VNSAPVPTTAVDRERLIGRVDGAQPGPVVIVIAGIHGNEPAGPIAARRVLESLVGGALPLSGTFVALTGNLAALQLGRRFVDRDLARLWTPAEVERARGSEQPSCVEQAELRGLLQEIDAIENEFADRDILLIELHSTSGPGVPFQAINDTLHDRVIAFASPIPLILGIEESIRGSMLDYMERQGRSVLVIEGGQHEAPETADNLESALWTVLSATGAVPVHSAVVEAKTERLRRAAAGAPVIAEVVYRHDTTPDDHFEMLPGFRHFQPIRRGELLAEDVRGPVRAPMSGLLLMPRYQGLGSDGFFIARPVRKSWLSLSAALRWLRVDRALIWLPGVRRDPARPRQVLVNPTIARFLVVPIFHLCGYRRLSPRDGRIVFARRIEAPTHGLS
jgi:succinylglutamate desuccinylase